MMKDLGDILRQAQQLQGNIAKMREALGEKRVEGSGGGGMVRAVATGNQEIISISIDKTVVDLDDIEMLQDLVTAAVNDALRQARQLAEREMADLTGGFGLPGLTC